VLINSTLEMIPPLRGFLLNAPGEIALRCALSVGLVVLIVHAMSRRKIYWRT
jgi:hypothetical protein